MKNEYRNAARSKALIKTAFIELLKEKPASKITVTDIIQRANVSRGTFYAHYLDARDLLESFERDFIDQLIRFTRKHREPLLVDKIELLLYKALDILKEDYAQRFDADFVLMTGILSKLTENLLDEFGGEKVRLG